MALPDEIDVTNAEHAAGLLRGSSTPGVTVVIADLTGTTFCDSAGIRMLTLVHQEAVAAGVQLRLAVATDGPVMRVLELLELVRILRVYPSVDAAADEPGPSSGQ